MVIEARNDSETDSQSDVDRLSEWSSTGLDGEGSHDNASEESSQVAADEGLPMSPGQAAAVIQG